MTSPATAFRWFFSGLALGCFLGIYYGFLRPLRPRHTLLSDLLFVPVAGWVWLYYSFKICGGDIRLGCSLSLPMGILLWDRTVGRLTRPLFDAFWRLIFAPFRFFVKKFQNFCKFLLQVKKERLQ